MKKLLCILVSLFLVTQAYSASVLLMWQYNGDNYNELSIKSLKIYYGGQETNYTNAVIGSVGNILPSYRIGFNGFDSCTFENIMHNTEIKIGGLKLYQPFYYGVAYINISNEVSPIRYQTTCGYTITNNVDVKILSPLNLKMVK